MAPVIDLCAPRGDIDAQCAGLLRILEAPVADPAAVALIRLPMRRALGGAFARHVADWPVARIACEWERFRIEAAQLLARIDAHELAAC